MKVKGADEAKGCIARRKSFRWMGWRGMKSKTAEGCYGVFQREKNFGVSSGVMTQLAAVYEPKTAKWYVTSTWLAAIQARKLDLPFDSIYLMDLNGIGLQEIYKGGYEALVVRRIRGEL